VSATSRTKAEKAETNDYYRTPRWAVEAIMPFIAKGAPVFDPCAGTGAILAPFFEAGHAVYGIELDPTLVKASDTLAARMVVVRDALEEQGWPFAERGPIVMNPPFKLAESFIRRAVLESPAHDVWALLRLGFLEGRGRAEFHKSHPSDVYVLPRRPSFCLTATCKSRKVCGWRVQLPTEAKDPRACAKCGGAISVSRSDASAYAWFRFGPQSTGRIVHLEVS
jgi:hypothetical protein